MQAKVVPYLVWFQEHVFYGRHYVHFLHGAPGSWPAPVQGLLPQRQPQVPEGWRVD